MNTKINIILFSLLLFLISCSKEENLLEQDNDNQEALFPSEGNEDIPVFNSWEDIGNYWKSQTNNSSISDNNQKGSSNITEHTYTGYTGSSSGKEQKGMFSAELATKLGLKANIIYTYRFFNVIYKIDLKAMGATEKNKLLLAPMESPNCGFADIFELSRGYSLGNNTLATLIIQILTDNSGTPINSFKPCHPDELEWNFRILRYTE